MLIRKIILLSSVFYFVSCATYQENPNYNYSTNYMSSKNKVVMNSKISEKNDPNVLNNKTSQVPLPDKFQTNNSCIKSANANKIIGAGIGGLVGSIAGKGISSGKTGAIIGAGLGGATGYKVGELLSDCNGLTKPLETNLVTKDHGKVIKAKTLYSLDGEDPVNYSPTSPSKTVLNEVTYDYSANSLLSSNEDDNLDLVEATKHKVIKGDTIYSLAKMLCQDISDIKRLNDLNSSYNIQLGTLLTLPPSAC